METKKNPAKDIHRKSAMFFQLGLGISVALAITAFEWRTEVVKVKPRMVDVYEQPITLIPLTEHRPIEPPIPLPRTESVVQYKDFLNTSDDAATSSELLKTDCYTLDPTELTSINITLPIDSADECLDCLIVIAEKQPEPIGGYDGFYSLLKKNLKYPRQAKQIGMEGRVFIEFIVNRDGTPSDMKVLRGIGAGCDEEAMRVIAITKWNPGKQRGKPVRVKMVMPIVFQLN